MKKCFVVRGIPGSGKTTWAKSQIAAETGGMSSLFSVGRFEADDFHMVGGEYVFKPENIALAHRHCYLNFCRAIGMQKDIIAVANTNLLPWEYAPYYRHAEAFGYDVELVTLACNIETAFARHVHGVPRDRFDLMFLSLELGTQQIPKFWKHRVVCTD